jgi:acyl-CoA reductase-like NAD-dependent aldehyde dehydrogenase
MADARLPVLKTYKLYLGGAFPRTESGRTLEVLDQRGRLVAHACRGSRKDLRNAVVAARGAQQKWADRTAYLRGQILYRMAEMLEGRAEEFAGVLRQGGATAAAARKEVLLSVDCLVAFAGWADKYSQVLGCHNPVAAPYYNFSVPEPTGVVGLLAPDRSPILGLVSLLAPQLCVGNTVVALGSSAEPLATALLGEVCAVSDVPAGVVNLLTGLRDELLPEFAAHRDLDAIASAGLRPAERRELDLGRADNLKRVHHEAWGKGVLEDPAVMHSPDRLLPFVEIKTIWHPVGR